jgi:hypothetical protein
MEYRRHEDKPSMGWTLTTNCCGRSIIFGFISPEQRGFKFTCPSKFRENEDEQFMMEGY